MRFALLILYAISVAHADQSATAAAAARSYRQSHERPIIDEYMALLAIPNVARNLDDMRRNASHIRQLMEKRGIRTTQWELPSAPPLIYGELLAPNATQTILFYVHYDGQPVDPTQWATSPFQPVLRDASLDAGGKRIPFPPPGQPFHPEWRIYARSAGDDKAPIITLLTALDALRAANIPLTSNIKFVLDGEEEAGSPHLAQYIREHQTQLAANVWIFCDGPVHQSRKQQVVFGVRGSTTLGLTIYGPRRELHSGHYGNWAPNPAAMLTRLLASMRDDDGRVLIPGFYDDVEPLSDREKQALAAVPNIDPLLMAELAIARTEGNGKRLDELITLPALNIQGISSANTGPEARNVVPATASAALGIRLVRGMDPKRTLDKITAHIRAQGYYVTDREPDAETRRKYPKICRISSRDSDGYPAVRAPMDLPISQRVIAAVKAAHRDVILLPTLGGSLPIAPIADIMRAPVIVVPIANHDNNQHGHNENMRLKNLWDGIETMAALLVL